MTDYMAMEPADMLHALNDDADKWADAFLQRFPNCGIPQDEVMAWFTNAIEHSYDYRTGQIINGEHAQYLIERGEKR